MKDQYIGDINDFHKYALLRTLCSASGAPLRVCWMRTPPDGRSDGARLSYLDDPARFRKLDPPLFDALEGIVSAGSRRVDELQEAKVLERAVFHEEFLSDDLEGRQLYFSQFFTRIGAGEIVFFDPDNGLEVSSVKKGRRNSSKYLYWDELRFAMGQERVTCVYQHFPRRPRQPFLADLLRRMEELAPAHSAFAVATSWVAYLICAPDEQARELIEAVEARAVHGGWNLSFGRRP